MSETEAVVHRCEICGTGDSDAWVPMVHPAERCAKCAPSLPPILLTIRDHDRLLPRPKGVFGTRAILETQLVDVAGVAGVHETCGGVIRACVTAVGAAGGAMEGKPTRRVLFCASCGLRFVYYGGITTFAELRAACEKGTALP